MDSLDSGVFPLTLLPRQPIRQAFPPGQGMVRELIEKENRQPLLQIKKRKTGDEASDLRVAKNKKHNLKRGYIVLLMSVRPYVRLSTRWFPDDNSRTLRPRIMKLHRYIDHDSQMTAIDFQVTRIMKLHRFIDHDWQITPNNVQVTRSRSQ
ncbi:hypothetical protein DPMN_141078 [Dreissena polymorpha]|uniref:Uncharacterized protein n=1 Tax=Dreissena polymorpha TaxID=45954 RepID=A0A9D4GER0_DREPO|nr:hypothetical protein DPMN_141078 [Dreissena polymorpha]